MLMSYSRLVIVVLILWGLGPILRNGCEIYSFIHSFIHSFIREMSAGLHSRNLILRIHCYRIVTIAEYSRPNG